MNSNLQGILPLAPLAMRNCMLLVFFASAVHVATAPAQQCESHWSILDQYKTIPTDGITFCDGTDGAQTGGAQTNNGQPGGTSTSNEVLSVQPQSPAQSSSPASQIGASLGNNAPSLQSTDGSPAISITNDSCYGGNVEQVVSGKCKPGFRNTVFNPPAIHTPGWPNGPWDTIKQYNVTNFSQFSCLLANDYFQADEPLKLPSIWRMITDIPGQQCRARWPAHGFRY